MLRVTDLKRPLPGLPAFIESGTDDFHFKTCTWIDYYSRKHTRQISNFWIEVVEEGLFKITCKGEETQHKYTRQDIATVIHFRKYLLELKGCFPIFFGT